MQRRRDWRTRLHEEIERHRRVPFSWDGGNDCAMFAADCVKAMTGNDPAAGFRGRYKSPDGALRAIRKTVHRDLISNIAARFEEVPPIKARAGDIACFRTEDALGWSIGVVVGETVAVRMPQGIGSMHLVTADKAFRVG